MFTITSSRRHPSNLRHPTARILRRDKARAFRESGITNQRNEHLATTAGNAVSAEKLPVGGNASSVSYGVNGQRYKQVLDKSGTLAETTTYIGSLIETVEKVGEPTQHRHMIFADGAVVAQHTRKSDNTIQQRYLHRDHLGSIDAMTDDDGNLAAPRMSFGSWGNRRNATTPDSALSALDLADVRDESHRGYTGHEMLDDVGFVHMNGRAYDPEIGRFLSVDPVFAYPDNPQSLNPYSYVHNNPLSLTDPSGYSAKKHESSGTTDRDQVNEDDKTTETGGEQLSEVGGNGARNNNSPSSMQAGNRATDEHENPSQRPSTPQPDEPVELPKMVIKGKKEEDSQNRLFLLLLGVAAVDSPAPGPADVVAIGLAIGIVTGLVNIPPSELDAMFENFAANVRLPNTMNNEDGSNNNDDRDSAQDKKLSKGEIDKLIKGGVHPHDLKDNARQDLFKDKDGNIVVKPKDGSGSGDPTGININDF